MKLYRFYNKDVGKEICVYFLIIFIFNSKFNIYLITNTSNMNTKFNLVHLNLIYIIKIPFICGTQ